MCHFRAVVLLVICGLVVTTSAATSMSYQTYCAITLDRMALAADTWEASGRPPTPDEEAAIYSENEVSPREYSRFRSQYTKEIDAYIDANPDVKQAIDEAKHRLMSIVEQYGESSPSDDNTEPGFGG